MNPNFSTTKVLQALFVLCLLFTTQIVFAQIVPVGSGSYTLTFPGTDVAGRNGFPSGAPLTTGAAAGKPAPTNDWWSNKIKNNHSDNLFNYPYTLKTVNSGLVVTYIPWGVIDDVQPVVVGVSGLNASAAKVSDFSDWTVSMNWNNGSNSFTATSGLAMPFLYFTKDSASTAQVTVNQGTATIDNEKLVIMNARNGADFVVYAPKGSVWLKSGSVYTSTLNGKNYWSMAFIPLTVSDVNSTANIYQKYAYVFPTNTLANWSYNENTAIVRTEFVVEKEIKEGTDSVVLLGLLPHQWSHLVSGSPSFETYTYAGVRGQIKTMATNRYSVENKFYGILPTLPYLDYYSNGFSPLKLQEKIDALKNEGLSTWTDSYNEGQVLNRLIQTARIAELTKDTAALRTIFVTVKDRLENWLHAKPGEVAFLFYYNQNWSTLIGYPAGHGQDGNINDHHFHWGYFIHAASFVEQFEPGWISKWGTMVNLLVKDAANSERNSTQFPYLRNFSPYAGHCWANGFATFPQGNDQESTSESMQFNSSLIHWGAVTNNKAIRDLGIYLYTTEQSAIEEYWLDIHDRNFGPNQSYSLVSRVWGNSYDNGTFWTSDIAASYGIEMYPIHGGSLYLSSDTNYVKRLWAEIEKNTGILSNQVNDNLWHDVMYSYLAFVNPQKAIDLYNSNTNRNLKFGISDAQTYHWLHSMNVLGTFNTAISSNYPLAAVFTKNGVNTYVAHNYSNTSIQVTFSDAYVLTVPARQMATSKDVTIGGSLQSNFTQAYPGGSVQLQMQVIGGTPSKVIFMNGEVELGEDNVAPYAIKASNLPVGKNYLYAKVYSGTNYKLSNFVVVTVGDRLPYTGNPINIPGTVMAGEFDVFEGGVGQGITYNDNAAKNEGDFRTTEYVDASSDATEGKVVGWITAGEWLSYTVDVKQAGTYQLQMRYACGNNAGGGPFSIYADEQLVASNVSVTYTGNWTTWANKSIASIPLKSGVQVLKLVFESGELNIGKLTFSYNGPLTYNQPIANAGANKLVVLPTSTSSLDGSASSVPGSGTLSYEWLQVYGPSVLTFSNKQVVAPTVSGLEEGIYLIRLKVSSGAYSDEDDMYLISSTQNNVLPKISINSPVDKTRHLANEPVFISALASDLNGSIAEVKFYASQKFIGSTTQYPYQMNWNAAVGIYSITAVATDNNGASTTSAPVLVYVDPTPSCRGTAFNSDYDYLFSEDENNPTITFIPSKTGVGSPTCILYYGANANSMPGYIVTPNVPYRMTASKGTMVYFYYTYSYPGAGEKNTSTNKNSYKIGSCKPGVPTGITNSSTLDEIKYYPNPVSAVLTVELPQGEAWVEVYNSAGQLVATAVKAENLLNIDMSDYAKGVYFVRVKQDNRLSQFKVLR